MPAQPPFPSRRSFCKWSAAVAGSSLLWSRAASSASAAAEAAAPPPADAAAPTPAPPPDVTRQLARHVLASQLANIPADVRKEAVRSVLNYVGCAIGGSRHETVDIALAALGEFCGPPKATVLGRRDRSDALHAALFNGISSHVFDYDDTHLRTIIHPAGPVASALFSLAEHRGNVSGADFLQAFIIGVEVECRLGNSVFPAHYEAGWHITGTCGVFGAAAATGKILGLNEQQMVWALGIAATQSAGLKEMFGTMCKSFHPGSAAQNGLKAALLASKNFTSAEHAIEAKPNGWSYALSSERHFGELLDHWGEHWEVSQNTYKPFPCGIVLHPALDACIQLQRENKLTPDQIASVAVRGNPQVEKLTGKKTPSTGLETKFSVYHACAVALARGKAGMKEFSDAAAKDPTVLALRSKVALTIDPKIREDEVYVTVTTTDGRHLEKHIEHAIGSRENPMSDAALEEKFRGLAEDVLPKEQTDRVIALCRALPEQKDVAVIPRATAVTS